MFGENSNRTKLYEERKMASRILQALTESTLADELKFYQRVVQNDLHLTDEQMTSLFSFSKFAELIVPDEPIVRKYKGVSVETYQNVVLNCNHTQVEEIAAALQEDVLELKKDLEEHLGREPTKDELAVAVAFTNDLENERPEANEVLQKIVEKEAEVISVKPEPEKQPEREESSESDENEPEKKTVEPRKEKEPEEDEESSDEEEDPVEILRQKLKSKGLNNLTFNDTKIPGSIIVTGKVNLKKGEHDKIRSLGGVWTASESGFIFSVKKLMK